MSPFARGFAALGAIVVTALGLAAGSAVVQHRVPMAVGNGCRAGVDNPDGTCFERLPVGGWPFGYLYDSPATSVLGQLGFEDDFRPVPFLVDAALLGVPPTVGVLALLARRRRAPASSRT